MEWDKNKVIKAIIFGMIVAVFILLKEHYSIRECDFICNENICQITHKNTRNKIVQTKKVDISNVKDFEYRLENIPREFLSKRRGEFSYLAGPGFENRNKAYYIYVNCYNGKSYKLSPLYYRWTYYKSEQLVKDAVDNLNKSLKTDPLDIRYSYR